MGKFFLLSIFKPSQANVYVKVSLLCVFVLGLDILVVQPIDRIQIFWPGKLEFENLLSLLEEQHVSTSSGRLQVTTFFCCWYNKGSHNIPQDEGSMCLLEALEERANKPVSSEFIVKVINIIQK